jgi:hypothetical protein
MLRANSSFAAERTRSAGIEVAGELIEAVQRRQIFVAVAQVVLADLGSGIALRFEQFGDGQVFVLKTLLGAGQTNLEESGS